MENADKLWDDATSAQDFQAFFWRGGAISTPYLLGTDAGLLILTPTKWGFGFLRSTRDPSHARAFSCFQDIHCVQ